MKVGGWDRNKEVGWQLRTVRNRKSPSSSIKSKRLPFPAAEILHGPHNSYRRAELEISSESCPQYEHMMMMMCVCVAGVGVGVGVCACVWLGMCACGKVERQK